MLPPALGPFTGWDFNIGLTFLLFGTPSTSAGDTWKHFALCSEAVGTSKEAEKTASLPGASPQTLAPSLCGYVWIEDLHSESFRAPGKLPKKKAN